MGSYYYFFPEESDTKAAQRRLERIAKQICATCPVLRECRDYALTNNEPHGVWGGLSLMERRERSRV